MSLKRFDLYPKLSDEFKVKTASGAIVSVCAVLLIIYLLMSELRDFLSTDTVSHLYVDTGRGEKLQINFDLTLPFLPCSLLSLDAMDVSGAHQLHVTSQIKKQSLDKDGLVIGGEVKHELKADVDKRQANVTDKQVALSELRKQPGYCGSCYGAESTPGQCCQSCDAVKDQYRLHGWALPPLTNIDQCVAEGLSEDSFIGELQRKEGCRIYGHLQVNKVAGNFHIAPGRSFQHAHMHIHDLAELQGSRFNMSHTINSLSFGDEFPNMRNPLDKTTRIQPADTDSAMFMNYVKIVPTNYFSLNSSVLRTNQFSVTEHFRSVNAAAGQGLPGVFFFYELSPIKLDIQESKMGFGHFLVQLCAILGGVYAVAGLIDRIVYSAARHVEAKRQQGKLY